MYLIRARAAHSETGAAAGAQKVGEENRTHG
jgi:hypothetical protein